MKSEEIVDRFVKTLNVPAGVVWEILQETGLVAADPNERTYLDKGGMVCPFCGSDQLDAGPMDDQEQVIYQNVVCRVCQREWTDSYTLTGMTYGIGRHSTGCPGCGGVSGCWCEQ